mgnify:FL=1
MSTFKLDRIDHVALTVRDVKRSVAWYKEVLGLERRYQEAWGDYPAVVGAGETSLALFPCESPNPKPRPDHDTIAMRHVAFAMDRANFQQAQARFQELGIKFDFEDHTICHSIYISDPDGHQLEVTTYDI